MFSRTLRVAIAAVVAALGSCSAADAAQVSICNVPIKMSDGVVLRANIWLPSSSGRFPTVLTVTGYNKDASHPPGTGCAPGDGITGTDANMVPAGYAVMVVDDRGTGASQGVWDSWGARTQQDYSEVLDWIQRQGWSTGSVGDYGGSYMGITSLLVAEADAQRVAQGKQRAVKAIWADVPMADAYRDVTFHGGAADSGFIPLWLGLTSGLSDLPPSDLFSDPEAAAQTYAGHLANTWGFAGQRLVDVTSGGNSAYDGPFYQLRSPVRRIASLNIPVAWTGGWWDIFQRGEPLLYEQMSGSPDKVWFQTPNYHGAPNAQAWAQMGIGSEEQVVLRWFDHWLRGAPNGVQSLPHVNLYTMGANRWERPASWPVPGTRYTPYYLSSAKSGSAQSLNDGSLTTARPAAPSGDPAPLLPASSPCSRLSTQWTAGLAGSGTPCETDNRSFEASSLTYTTAPLTHDSEVTGPITANLWAELAGARDATLVAALSDVSPSGQSTQVTAGFLLASQRAVDRSRSTFAPGGVLIRPWHPFTQASQEPVPPNDPQQYEVEIYPTSNVFKAGDRIRLTVASADTPATAPPVPDLLNEAGGQIRMLSGGAHPSSVLLPLQPR